MGDIHELFSVKGKKALVTGVSSQIGLGYACAEILVAGGAEVIIVARSERCREAAKALGATAMIADLAQLEEAESVVPRALETMGGLDILINNAGVLIRDLAVDYRHEDYRKTMAVNLDAAFILAQAAGRHMLAQGYGKIINMASMNSFVGGQRVVAYALSKAALAQLTKTLADEWASSGVNVNAIAPGYMRTELTERLLNNPDRAPAFLARIPAGRWGTGADLQGTVIYLSSAASDYVHGTIIRVDGGYLAR